MLKGVRGGVESSRRFSRLPESSLFLSLPCERPHSSFSVCVCVCHSLSRVCEYVGTLEHTHFSDSTSQPPLTISQPQKTSGGNRVLGDPECEDAGQEQSLEQESSLNMAPVLQPLSIQELIREGSRGRASDFRGSSLMTGSSAAKALLILSTQADRFVHPSFPHLSMSITMIPYCSWGSLIKFKFRSSNLISPFDLFFFIQTFIYPQTPAFKKNYFLHSNALVFDYERTIESPRLSL